MEKKIKLSNSTLNQIITESIRTVLKEYVDDPIKQSNFFKNNLQSYVRSFPFANYECIRSANKIEGTTVPEKEIIRITGHYRGEDLSLDGLLNARKEMSRRSPLYALLFKIAHEAARWHMIGWGTESELQWLSEKVKTDGDQFRLSIVLKYGV